MLNQGGGRAHYSIAGSGRGGADRERRGRQQKEDGSVSAVLGSGLTAFRAAHDRRPFARTDEPLPCSPTPAHHRFKNRKSFRPCHRPVPPTPICLSLLLRGSKFSMSTYSNKTAPSRKTALFIDGANLFATSETPGFEVDYRRLLKEFQGRGMLLRAFCHAAAVEDQEFSSLRPLIDWLDRNGYTAVTKAAKEFIDGNCRRKFTPASCRQPNRTNPCNMTMQPSPVAPWIVSRSGGIRRALKRREDLQLFGKIVTGV
jgi:NYN domain